MFGARTGTVIGSNFNATLIIFKNFASDDWNIRIDGETTICQFMIKMTSRSAEDKAMYSASVVLSATRV